MFDSPVIIIQARMGSSRLPNKALLKIGDKSSIGWAISRCQKSKLSKLVMLATGKSSDNDLLVQEAALCNIPVYRGDDDYLLNRYYECAQSFLPSSIVRITGDCPFIDPAIIDKVIDLFYLSKADYASNVHPPTFPDGFDVEIFSYKALEKAWKQARVQSDREHATPYFWKKTGLFTCVNLENPVDLSSMRIVLDYESDLKILRDIESRLDLEIAGLDDIVAAYSAVNPGMLPERNEGYAQSISVDKDSYDKSLEKSERLISESSKLIPSSAQTYSKSYRHFAYPVFLDYGQDGHVWDVDGNEYVDFICGLGAIILGYNNKFVNDAVQKQIYKGVSFSQPNALEVELANLCCQTIPCAEKVKFLKNGSDATTAAVRLARAFTGRDIVLCCGYHGYHDWYVGQTSNCRGVPVQVQNLTKTFEYNNISSLENRFNEYPNQVACVIMEPFQQDGPRGGFLSQVRKVCNTNNSVLIFDEVVSGFRSLQASAQKHFGVIPDLSSFGKAMANGFPISAVVGKAEIMDMIDNGAFISTTMGGDAVSISAAIATINRLNECNGYETIHNLGSRWKNSIAEFINTNNFNWATVVGMASHCGLVFKAFDAFTELEILSFYQQSMAEHGILSLGINNFCESHSERDIDNFIYTTELCLKNINSKNITFCRKYRVNPVFRR